MMHSDDLPNDHDFMRLLSTDTVYRQEAHIGSGCKKRYQKVIISKDYRRILPWMG